MKGVTVHKIKNTLLNIEWNFFGGGFLHVGRMNWTLSQRIGLKGSAINGSQKEFTFRVQLALDHEDKFSWFTLELVNPFEARWFILWTKIWKGHNLKFSFNLGWRLTRESRDFLERQALEASRRVRNTMREGLKVVGGK